MAPTGSRRRSKAMPKSCPGKAKSKEIWISWLGGAGPQREARGKLLELPSSMDPEMALEVELACGCSSTGLGDGEAMPNAPAATSPRPVKEKLGRERRTNESARSG